MRGRCIVPGCSGQDPQKFSVPMNPERCQEWIQRIKSPLLTDSSQWKQKTFFLCSKHFDKRLFRPKNRLCNRALPTLHLPYYHGSENYISMKPTDEPKLHTFPDEISKAIKQIQESFTQQKHTIPFEKIRLCRSFPPKKTYSKKAVNSEEDTDLKIERIVPDLKSINNCKSSERYAPTSLWYDSPSTNAVAINPQKQTPTCPSYQLKVNKNSLIKERPKEKLKKKQSPRTTNNATLSQHTHHKKRSKKDAFNDEPKLDVMFENRHERLHDDSAIYGYHVASKHRKYSAHTRSVVEHLIGNILYKADMGMFEQQNNANTSVTSTQSQQIRYTKNENNVHHEASSSGIVDVYEEHLLDEPSLITAEDLLRHPQQPIQLAEEIIGDTPEYGLVVYEPKTSTK